MTANKHYQEFMRAKIQGAITEAKAASMLTHQGVKGTVLEILISRLFRPLLPSDLGVGTGQVIDQHGHISNQVDIILYDRSILPPALYDDHMGLFPIEAVLYTIEVKTTLTRSDLVQAHVAAKKIFDFVYMSGLTNRDGGTQDHHVDKVRSVVFALASDVKMGEADRYASIYTQRNELAHLAAICVAEKEYVYQAPRRWVVQPSAVPGDELLSFLGGVMNTYKDVARSRHSPLLGHYIIPKSAAKDGPAIGHSGVVAMHCKQCQAVANVAPRIPHMNEVVVNGSITLESIPCPSCGGVLEAPRAKYTFRRGELHDVAELPVEPAEDSAVR